MRGELSGERLGNYRLESVLGRGGMGVVYRAEQISLGRVVAVKVIAPALSQDPMLRSRFKQEAQLAASLDHPNVLPIHEADEAGGLLYIAMRYVEGVDLGDAIRQRGRLPTDEATAIVMQIAGALDAAHSRGLVHRDVKPANVLLAGSSTQIAYLTDFGLTKHVGAVSGPTQSGQFVGTPDYAAPEQIQGHAVNAATDVYALGCVLHEALTGTVPFPRESNVAKMYAHISDPPPRPSDLADGISPALDDVIARALSKEPADRQPSAGDLGRAAVAAAADRRAPSNEHSVAVGEAALSGTKATHPRDGVDAASTEQRLSSVPTAHLPNELAAPSGGASRQAVQVHRGGRRPRALVGVTVASVVALLAAAGVAAVILTNNRTAAAPDSAATTQPVKPATVSSTPAVATKTPSASAPVDVGTGLLPAVPKATMTVQIRSLLRRFFETQIANDYGALSRMTTTRYQRRVIAPLGFAKWVSYQQTGAQHFRDPQTIEVTVVATDPSDGSVTLDVRGMRYSQSGSPCVKWQGISWARYEHGRWRYDPSPDATSPRHTEWSGRGDELIGAHCIV